MATFASMDTNQDPWWRAEKGKVHDAVFRYVRQVESEQSDVFFRHAKIEHLYDPNTPDGPGDSGRVTENGIATGVDTVAAIVATQDIRARVMTDGADWSQSRRARHIEFYAEERQAGLGINAKCRRSFKEADKKGMGLTKGSIRFGKPHIEFVAVENCVVDHMEGRDGRRPMQFHQWDYVDAEELMARFPKHADAIWAARGRNGEWSRLSGRYQMPAHQVSVLFSWRLPIGVKGQDGYRAGREVVTMEGIDLYDEPYHDDFFPFDEMAWSERAKSWYPIGGVERVMGIQRALNKRNHTIEKCLERAAFPTTYGHHADMHAAAVTNEVGVFVPVKNMQQKPETVVHTALNPEVVNSRQSLRDSILNEMGVNAMMAHGTKPGGEWSAVALRELNDSTTVRYSEQEIRYEEHVIGTIWLSLVMCKKLGKKAPRMIRRGRFGSRQIDWDKVDVRELRIQMKAASNTTRQPWGRVQTVMELAQGGLVSTDSARRMLKHLDIDQELSLYMAALESIEGDLDDIADGMVVVPEPATNHAMAVWRAQNEYLKWRRESAPEEILEVLRDYFTLAAHYVSLAEMPAAGAPANGNIDPMAPPMPGAVPPMGQPSAALAPEAMQVVA